MLLLYSIFFWKIYGPYVCCSQISTVQMKRTPPDSQHRWAMWSTAVSTFPSRTRAQVLQHQRVSRWSLGSELLWPGEGLWSWPHGFYFSCTSLRKLHVCFMSLPDMCLFSPLFFHMFILRVVFTWRLYLNVWKYHSFNSLSFKCCWTDNKAEKNTNLNQIWI